ncbi:halovibrin HvnA [Pseudomonas sp. 250J]|nr:halovibrin HvnA [Pseudomonas sp. 250J]
MNLRVLVLTCLLVSGCATPPPTANSPSQMTQDGALVAARLNERYNYAPPDCGEDSKPAFLCSGVIFRATRYSPEYDSWNPSPNSVASGGVSFSYLRKDAKFKNMVPGQHNGFIFHPVLNTPFGKQTFNILCYFPIDADTDQREKPGCGEHKDYPSVSRSCELQNIDAALAWHIHYLATQMTRESQCGFNIRDDRNEAAGPAFKQAMLVHNISGAIQDHLFQTANEFRIATWPQNIPNELPIEAFFYVDSTGLGNARKDRDNFQNKTGTRMPLIKMTLPATLQQEARFEYIPGDNG